MFSIIPASTSVSLHVGCREALMGSASDLKEISRELSSMVFKVPKGKKARPRDSQVKKR